MWFILSLCALLCWSGSDLFSKLGSAPSDKTSHLKMTAAVGIIMGIHAAAVILFTDVSLTFSDIITYLPISAMYILSMILGYAGLRYIELSYSSPVCNSSGALVAVMCFVFLGSRPGVLTTIGVAVVCAGVISLSVFRCAEDPELAAQRQSAVKYSKSWLALLLPFLYCILDAASTYADGLVLDGVLAEDTANTAYELTFAAVGLLCAFYVYIIKRERFSFKKERFRGVAGVFETAGQLAYVYALSAETVAAAPVISSYCVLSVIWSRVFLREKLSVLQYISIGITALGIILLGVAEAV